jgi:hypothetical protein
MEFMIVGMAIHVQNGKDWKKSSSAQVWFTSMICLIFCDSRVIEGWFQVEDDEGPIKQLTP